jgi:large subunit ribosomal protein L1
MILTDKFLKEALAKAVDQSVWKKEGKPDRTRKFDESLDIIINFRDYDIKNPSLKIEQELILPHALRQKVNIAFIAEGDMFSAIKAKGYDVFDGVYLDELDKKDKKAKKKFVHKYTDFVCRADMMRNIAKVLGRFLGQVGKMPKPQPKGYGIIKPSENIDKVVDDFKKRISVATKKSPTIQTLFGKKSLSLEQNYENLRSIMNFIEPKMPNGQGNIKSIYIKTTMGTSIKVEEPLSKTAGKGKGGKK